MTKNIDSINKMNNVMIVGAGAAVLSLGDSFRMHYAQCGKDFDRMLEELGGVRIIDRIDCDGVVEAPLKEFQGKLLDYFESNKEQYPKFVRKEETPDPEPVKNVKSTDSNPTKKGILSRIKRRITNKIRRFL